VEEAEEDLLNLKLCMLRKKGSRSLCWAQNDKRKRRVFKRCHWHSKYRRRSWRRKTNRAKRQLLQVEWVEETAEPYRRVVKSSSFLVVAQENKASSSSRYLKQIKAECQDHCPKKQDDCRG